ncbi:hypothetical protein [Roseicella aquatilis]|uniref:hypothetical protein n=1 Tax=Roseicella aquatilis TaxID=2527868 RepID=UPI001048D9F7|nr:hypothetical protein [Roseicella aquatilis]
MKPEGFAARLTAAGIPPDKPLHGVLLTVHEAAETALATVTDKARGLTPQGEAELIARVSREAADAAESRVDRMVRGFSLRTALLAAFGGLVLLGAGYAVGRWDGVRVGAQGIEGSVFMAQIASLNDARALAQRCRETQRQAQGGTACDLPPVWVNRR